MSSRLGYLFYNLSSASLSSALTNNDRNQTSQTYTKEKYSHL